VDAFDRASAGDTVAAIGLDPNGVLMSQNESSLPRPPGLPSAADVADVADVAGPLSSYSQVLVTYDPLIRDAVYRPLVDFGQTWTLVAQLEAGAYQFVKIEFFLGEALWFETSWTLELTAMAQGITCVISNFSKDSATLRFTNRNSTKEPIILRVIPTFTNGVHLFQTKDPQIVLPPSKVPADGS
jgi:hypothetical protein